MPQTAAIKKLVPLSLAKVFATYYGFWGLVIGCIYLVQLKEDWYAPVGVLTLFYDLKINLTLHPEPNFLSKAGDLLWLSFYYALTGWLSGLMAAVIYNFCSRHLGVQIDATIEHDASAPQTQ
jgi:hypothetical protein